MKRWEGGGCGGGGSDGSGGARSGGFGDGGCGGDGDGSCGGDCEVQISTSFFSLLVMGLHARGSIFSCRVSG